MDLPGKKLMLTIIVVSSTVLSLSYLSLKECWYPLLAASCSSDVHSVCGRCNKHLGHICLHNTFYIPKQDYSGIEFPSPTFIVTCYLFIWSWPKCCFRLRVWLQWGNFQGFLGSVLIVQHVLVAL